MADPDEKPQANAGPVQQEAPKVEAPQLKTWFQTKGIPDTDADNYARSFVAQGIPDNEERLPDFRLTREDLKYLRVKVPHLQTILGAIQEVEGTPNLAEDRKDLVKRLFPVAVSVGFATPLVLMPWIHDENQWFDYDQFLQLARLVTGVFVVIFGWEWYHRDLKRQPERGPWRFYIDVAVIITTIIFLFSSKKEGIWLTSLLAIFLLYVLWDVSWMIEYWDDKKIPVASFTANCLWSIYFSLLLLGNTYFSLLLLGNTLQPLITCLFVLLGAVAVRFFGSRGPGPDTVKGFLCRVAVIGALAFLYLATTIVGIAMIIR